MNIIYQLGVQWGDVGRKCLLTELFFISSLARSASSPSSLLSLFYTLHLFFFFFEKRRISGWNSFHPAVMMLLSLSLLLSLYSPLLIKSLPSVQSQLFTKYNSKRKKKKEKEKERNKNVKMESELV